MYAIYNKSIIAVSQLESLFSYINMEHPEYKLNKERIDINSKTKDYLAEKYNEIRDRFNNNHNALDFCLLSRTCYSGIIRFRKADGYMSTPKGPHRPISPEAFSKRVDLWHDLINRATFTTMSFEQCMDNAQSGDVVYCDPPYTHSQSIIYGAQTFNIEDLFKKIAEE